MKNSIHQKSTVMKNPWLLHAERLNDLLDIALDLSEDERARFLRSDAVDAHLHDELVALLKNIPVEGMLDHTPDALSRKMLEEHRTDTNKIEIGQRFGQYRLNQLLGEGGMASVWLAERDVDGLSHTVAIKCLRTGLATPESRARFLREQQILAQLQHPYIARLYDAGLSDEEVPFIVMEYIDGGSITRYCDEHQLNLNQRLRLFQKVCTAVGYAHQNLIVHRDLKPANILIGADGEPKLLDFGIAKLLDDSEPVTRSGMYLFTPEYAAPEQIVGGIITTSTDVYALGAVLYELLSGLRARSFFRKRQAMEIEAITAPSEELKRLAKSIKESDKESPRPKQIAERRATTLERLRHALQGDLDTIVLKALKKEPERRYSTVQSFSEDIERYLQQKPIQARKDTWIYRGSKFLQRNAYSITLTTLVTIALLLISLVSLYRIEYEKIQVKRAAAVEEFLTNLIDITNASPPANPMSSIILLPDGAKFISAQLSNVPHWKFSLLFAFGRLHNRLGLYKQAETFLKETKNIADTQLSPSDESWLQVQTEWAHLLQESHVQPIDKLLAQSMDTYQSAGGEKNSLAFAAALDLEALTYQQLGRFDEAIKLAQESLVIYENLLGSHHVKVQKALDNLSLIFSNANRLSEAERVQRRVVKLTGELYQEDSVRYAASLSRLAWILLQQEKLTEAEGMLWKALAIQAPTYSRPNFEWLENINILSQTLLAQGQHLDAESIYKLTASPLMPTQQGVFMQLNMLADIAKSRHYDAEATRLKLAADASTQ